MCLVIKVIVLKKVDVFLLSISFQYTSEYGYDMRRNMDVDWDAQDKYSTTLFTEEATKLIREHDTKDPMFMYLAHLAPHTGNDDDPLQAPDDEIAKFAHIEDPERRVYAGEAISIMSSHSCRNYFRNMPTFRFTSKEIMYNIYFGFSYGVNVGSKHWKCYHSP